MRQVQPTTGIRGTITILVRGLVQSPCGKINVITTLGGGGLSASCFTTVYCIRSAIFSCDYTFLRLNKSIDMPPAFINESKFEILNLATVLNLA